jgi:hypothetical protein
MNSRAAGAAAAALVLLAGCVSGGEDEPDDVRSDQGDGQPVRGPVSLAGMEVHQIGPEEFAFDVPSCGGNPVLDQLVEDGEHVRILIVTTVPDSAGDCLDTLTVTLREPLGDRPLIDWESGETLPVTQPETGAELRTDAEPGPVPLHTSVAVAMNPTQLVLNMPSPSRSAPTEGEPAQNVPSCGREPFVDELDEDDEEVRIRVVTTVTDTGRQDDCVDTIVVTLDVPLDGRTLIDLVTGLPIDVQTATPDRP